MPNVVDLHHNRYYRQILIGIIVISALVHVLSLTLSKTLFEHWRFEHLQVHSVVEVAGSFIAFFVAYLLVLSDRRGEGTSFNVVIAGALVGMGLFDGLHALVHPGQAFVWLHSLATFVGGILFACVWLPQAAFRQLGMQWLYIVAGLSILIGGLSIIKPGLIPLMVDQGSFTILAELLNLSGGLLLLSAAVKLVITYRANKKNDDLLFVLHCSMFGLAAIMFEQSFLWDLSWWGWHVLRFLAYGVALWFAISSDVLLQRSIDEHIDELSMAIADQQENVLALQQAIDHSSNTQSAILSSLNDAIIIADKQGEITAFMSAAETMFGYSKEDVIGKNLKYLMNAEDARHHDQYMQHFRREKGNVVLGKSRELFARRKDGSVFPVEIVITELSMSGKFFFLGLIRDISERKEKSAQLKAALQEARSASVLKSEFLANMSHEVRTPLNAIYGAIQLLKKEPDLSDKVTGLIDKAAFSSRHLLTIINDILDFSKIEAGKLNLESVNFDLEKLVSHTLDSARALLLGKSILIERQWQIANPMRVGDPTRISQILNNLLSNAIKFTEQGTINVIVYEVTGEHGDLMTCLSVKDSGIGMSSAQLEKLFNRFEQADGSTTRKYGGTGLGMSIIKSLVEMMGGNISVESISGQGSHFVVQLPLKIGVAATTVIDNSSDNDSAMLAGKDILVVDDQVMNREIVGFALEEVAAIPRYAENGEQAIEEVLSKEPDLILMDIQMPVMDGQTACRKLRQQGCAVPIIALTANVMAEEIEQYMASGFDAHLGKPVNLGDLLAIASRHVTSAGFEYKRAT